MKQQPSSESTIRDRERMLATLLANLPGMAYRRRNDEHWTMDFVSNGCRELIGYVPEELVSNQKISYAEIICELDRDRVRDEVAAALQAGRRFELTYRIVTAHGDQRWVLEHGVAVPAVDGAEAYLEGIITDITARKWAEDALAERESVLAAILDNSFQYNGLLDPAGRVLRANPKSLDAVGIKAEDVQGRFFWDTPWWSHSATEQQKLRDAITRSAKGEFVRFETTHVTRDGRLQIIDFSLKAVRNIAGKVIMLVAEGRDITESKEAERALRESEDRFCKAFRATPDAISIVDLETGRILEINHAVERIFGFKERDVVGRTSVELNLWADPLDRQRMVEAIRRDGYVRDLQVTGLSKDGKPFICLFAAEKTEISGRACIVTVVRDITEQVRVEKALRESEEKFAKAFRSSPDAIAIIEQATGRIIDANSGHERIYGWTREELIGRSTIELGYYRDPADRDGLIAAFHANGGSVRDFEIACYNRKREPIMVSLSGEFIELNGKECLVCVAHDITERKRTEQALRESEEKFATAFRASPNGISINDLETGEYIEANVGHEKIFGFTREQLIGRSTLELGFYRDPAQRDRLIAALRANGGSIRDFELACYNKRREPITVSFSGEFIEMNGRKCLVSIVRDITESKRSEQALRESEEKFSKAFRASPDAISVSEFATGRIIDVNEAFERFSGYTRAELIGRTSIDVGFLSDQNDRRKLNDELVQHGRVRELQVTARSRSGATMTFVTSAETVEIGGKLCVVILGRDITDSIKAEQALRESEEKFGKAFRSSPYALTITEMDTGLLVDVNWGFERMTGYRREDVLGKTTLEVNLWPDSGDRDELLRRLHSDGRVRGAEMKFLNRMKEVLVTRCSCDVVDLGGKPCLLAVFEDITEQRKAENEHAAMELQFRQVQKLEALGQLAGGIAHDFNNILTGILAYAELATMDATDPAAVRGHLVEVGKAGRRARDLVRQILAFSRQQVNIRTPIRLHLVVQEAITLLRSSLPSSIDIRSDANHEAPVVLADATQIHQIVMNLCTNSAHAMRERQGILSIRLELRDLGEAPPGEIRRLQAGRYAVLTVSDNGHGMDDETLKHVFEPFFTTKAPGEGTGLGLSVVHGIIEDHDGVVLLESHVGKGTTFTLYFPEHIALTESNAAEPAALGPGKGERILLIDDEKMIADSAGMLLERLGYRVTAKVDPRAALQAFEENPNAFDLVVTDLTMPRLSGIEVARKILALRPELPVLLASGYNATWTPEKIRELGLAGLINKPLTTSALASAVRTALDEFPASIKNN